MSTLRHRPEPLTFSLRERASRSRCQLIFSQQPETQMSSALQKHTGDSLDADTLVLFIHLTASFVSAFCSFSFPLQRHSPHLHPFRSILTCSSFYSLFSYRIRSFFHLPKPLMASSFSISVSMSSIRFREWDLQKPSASTLRSR